ncbi:MAG: hypothetical protein QM725_11120 [Lacibacter sp.]
MKAYISVNFSKRKFLQHELDAIAEILTAFKILPFVFVDHYRFDPEQEQEMMMYAVKEIENSDLLIAETSYKGIGIGIGIEAGYAKGKGKPIIYMRHKNAEHSTTVSGVSDYHIIYSDEDEMKVKLNNVLQKITSNQPQ